MRAQSFVNAGYQRLLTFESPTGGFNWWGNSDPGNVVLTGLGIQQFDEMSKVHEVDRRIIERSNRWLASKQSADGSWAKGDQLHSNNAQLGSSNLRVTAWILWSLLQTGNQGAHIEKGIKYLKTHLQDGKGDLYAQAMAALALAHWNARDPVLSALLGELARQRVEDPKTKTVYWPTAGDTETYSRGTTAAIETTALVALAMMKADVHHALVNGALGFIVQNKGAYGNWESTQATILALRALLSAAMGSGENADLRVSVLLDGRLIGEQRFTPKNSDILRLIDAGVVQPGRHKVELRSQGRANVMYQVVGRYYRPWSGPVAKQAEPITIKLRYDRTRLRVDDVLTANVDVTYHLPRPTFMVIVDLGIPPGFTVQQEDLAELVKRQVITRFSTTGRQITLYVGVMQKERPLHLRYRLKAKFPIRAKTPRSVAYEYYTPSSRGVQQPETIIVEHR